MITEYDNFINKEDLEESIQDLTDEIEYLSIEEDVEGALAATSHDRLELIALKEEAEKYCDDWSYGAVLINDNFFEAFTKEMADDLFEIPDEWPFRCIDWEQAANELRDDYTIIEFRGIDFLCR